MVRGLASDALTDGLAEPLIDALAERLPDVLAEPGSCRHPHSAPGCGTLVRFGPPVPCSRKVASVVLLLIPAGLLAVLVGVTAGWRWVFAPLLAYALLTWLYGSLRALTRPSYHHVDADEQVDPVRDDQRTLFWCEECGTEVLLLVRGTPRAPSHCGQRMHERTEILN